MRSFFLTLTMIHLKTATPRWIIVVFDLCLSIFALGLSYFIRFDLNTNLKAMKTEWLGHWPEFLLYLFLKWIVFFFFKIHQGLIRYTSSAEIKRIFLASSACTLIFILISTIRAWGFNTTYLFPSSILIMEFFFSVLFLIGSRFVIKIWYYETVKNEETKERVVIFGAGSMGLLTKKTIENDHKNPQKVLAFYDENPRLKGVRIEGIKVLGKEDLVGFLKNNQVEKIIVAIRTPQKESLSWMVDFCLENRIKIQRVKDPATWVNGELTPKKIGKIAIEELLGREEIHLNQATLAQKCHEKTILITGAAGSIGSGIVREILPAITGKLILLDQAESPLYELQQELKDEPQFSSIQFIIGDVRNRSFLKELFEYHQPNIIYHAAAYKHVPLMEENPKEAIETNVQGTANLVDLSLDFGIEVFVLVSTDKAVNPTNIMGATKRIAEMYAQHQSQVGKTKFITTRFGNVLGSNGSVIPLFQRQIEAGGPVFVTHPEITRYFMTIAEACQLVLEASMMGLGGEIFVFDMGKSVKIVDLANKMILLNGLEPQKDITIQFTGLRPGEKLYEELLAHEETTLPTHHAKILIARIRSNQPQFIEQFKNLLSHQGSIHEKVALMKAMVPEYISQNSTFESLDAHGTV